MHVRRGCYFLFACFCIILGIATWSDITDNAFHGWISFKSFLKQDTRPETTKRIVFNGRHFMQRSGDVFSTVHVTTQYSRTTQVNNVTYYITSNNILQGRLGNMIFKYASLLGIARKLGRQMFINPGTHLGQTFKLTHEAVHEDAAKWAVITEESPVSFDPKLINLPSQNMRIQGYVSSFYYFADIMDEVRQELTFQDHIAVAAANILHDVYVKHKVSMIIGVHARRGDFLAKAEQRQGFQVPEKSYFMKAFSLMKSKFPGRNITFIVASDDLPWCKENLLGGDVIVMPDAAPAVHLAVLSKCEHMIISSGTFGWWSGWLANGHVIYYTDYLRNGSYLGKMLKRHQYYPRLWIGLSN